MSILSPLDELTCDPVPELTPWNSSRGGRRVNVYTENFVQIWVSLDEDDEDLHLTECADEAIGTPPEWFEYENNCSGLENWFDPDYRWNDKPQDGVFLNRWSYWAMERGLAPGQEFLVRLQMPTYSTSYEGEHDASFDSPEILEVERLTPLEVQRAWEHHLMESWRAHDERQRQHAVTKLRRETDASALSLDWRTNSGWHETNSKDTCSLISGHGHYFDNGRGHAHLCSGEAPQGRHDLAFARMLKTAIKQYPKLDHRKIARLYINRRPRWRLCRGHCGDRFRTMPPTRSFCFDCGILLARAHQLFVGAGMWSPPEIFETEAAKTPGEGPYVLLQAFRRNRLDFESAWRLGADEDTQRRILLGETKAA